MDDAGDDIVVNEDFCGTSAATAYDHAGNLIDDGVFVYVYDAWNRLVKVRSKNDADVTIQTAEFDALGRRIKKVVSKSGEYDKTEVYLYEGQKIIEIRNGSNAMVQQLIHGTQYIDELVMVRVKDKGDLYVHQDANWNVVGLTDLGGRLVERYVYSPYGELIVHQSTGYRDYDGDGDVDSSDRNFIAGACAGSNPAGACRILDLNFDNAVNSSDTAPFDALPQGLQRNPGTMSSAVSQPFAHQGLLFEPEIGSYQNRARQYDPGKRRFAQRDPISLVYDSFTISHHYLDGMNLSNYLNQQPLTRNDPYGLCGFNQDYWREVVYQSEDGCKAGVADIVQDSNDVNKNPSMCGTCHHVSPNDTWQAHMYQCSDFNNVCLPNGPAWVCYAKSIPPPTPGGPGSCTCVCECQGAT